MRACGIASLQDHFACRPCSNNERDTNELVSLLVVALALLVVVSLAVAVLKGAFVCVCVCVCGCLPQCMLHNDVDAGSCLQTTT